MTATEMIQKIEAELARLEGIEREATKGPWQVDDNNEGTIRILMESALVNRMRYRAHHEIQVCRDFEDGAQLKEIKTNAALIAAARNVLPGMLAYIREEADRIIEAYDEHEASNPGCDWASDDADEMIVRLRRIAAALDLFRDVMPEMPCGCYDGESCDTEKEPNA